MPVTHKHTGSITSDNLETSQPLPPPHRRSAVWGWALYDVANSAFATTILAVIFNKYYALKVAGGDAGVPFHWFSSSFSIPGTTLFSYFVSISTLFVMILSPLTGAMADESQRKKTFLFWTTLLGAVCTSLLWFVGEGDWLFGGVMFALANVGFNAGLTFYDALLKNVARTEEAGWVSGLGWGVGYLGGGLLLAINLMMLQPPSFLHITPFTVTDTFATVGVWWLLFSIPLMIWVKEPRGTEALNLVKLWQQSWTRLGRTLHDAKKMKDLVYFLVAFFFFNNGVQTVILMASIFAESELKMATSQLIIYFLMIQGCGFLGSLFLGRFADRIGDKRLLLFTIVIWAIICIWTYSLGVFTDQVTEFYGIGILAGLVLGTSQASSRSLFARFTPEERAAEFFGFFSVQARLSSLLGPLVYGTTLWISGSIRLAILCLIIFFIIGGLLLLRVNEQRGIETAKTL